MPTDIAGRPRVHRRLAPPEVEILAFMVAGDPGPTAYRPPRRYSIVAMAARLHMVDTPVLGRPLREAPIYPWITRLAEDGFLDTAGRRRYALLTAAQRGVAMAVLAKAGRPVPVAAAPTALDHFGVALDDADRALLRALLGHRVMTPHYPYDLARPTRAAATASQEEIARAAATTTGQDAERRLRGLSGFDLVSRTGGSSTYYYFTRKQFDRMVKAYHRGLLGYDTPANLATVDSNGRPLAAGAAVRTAVQLVDQGDLPVHYRGIRPRGLAGRIERSVAFQADQAWFLVDFGRGGKAIYSRRELTAIAAAVPARPTNCTVVYADSSPPFATVAWDGPDDCHFRIEWRSSFGRWRSLSAGRGKSYIDRGVRPGVVNIYRVRAVNVEGSSPPSLPTKGTSPPAVLAAEPQLCVPIPPAVVPVPGRVIRPRQRIVDTD
jgi:hypothetical protein